MRALSHLLLLVTSLTLGAFATTSHAAQAESSKQSVSVDAFYGAYQETVPISVPPFRGLEPKLGLSYSSSAPDGIFGLGWNLDGLSTIERANRGKGAPAYTSNDTFLLDGQELVPCTVLGGTHCTKIQSYLRIKQDSSADTWTVWQKDGTKTVYGSVFDVGGNTFRWGIKSVSDTRNNTVYYNWWCDSGADCYPSTITYNGVTIQFHRELRAEPISFATGSSLGKSRYRIKTIDVRVGTSRVRAYRLSYTESSTTGRSLLTSARSFGRDAYVDATGTVTSGTSVPAMSFGYGGGTAGFSTAFTGPSWSDDSGWSDPSNYRTIRYPDINGDGKADICARANAGIRCYLSNGSGYGTYVYGPALSDDTGWADYDNYSTIDYPDINGDGKADLCARANAGIRCYLSNGTSFGGGIVGPALSDDTGWSDRSNYATIQFPDFNGDGKADICARANAGIRCYPSTGSGFGAGIAGPALSDDTGWADVSNYATIRYPDINGDGKADICARANAGIRCYLSTGSGFTSGIVGPALADDTGWSDSTNYTTIQYPDINGDGKADICARANAGIRCYLSTGSGFTSGIAGPGWSDDTGWNDVANYSTIQYPDLNGDGRADICARANAGIRCQLSNGQGFTDSIVGPGWSDDTGWSDVSNYGTIQFPDINGDGKADIIARANAYFTARITNTNGRETLRSVANGMGATTTIAYTPSSAWSNTNNPPLIDTATSVTVHDGRGGSATTRFSYQGGLFDPMERRFMGFRYAKTTEPCISGESACPYQQTYFKQDYGSVSKPESVYQKDGSGKLLSYRKHVYVTNGATVPYTSLESQQWEYIYDAAGAYKRSVVTRSFDAYANVTVEYLYGDYDQSGDEKTIRYRYYPNTTSYVVGKHAAIDMFAGLGTGGSLLTQALLYYDGNSSWAAAPSAGKVTKTASWLSSTNSYVSKHVEYDSWGNVTAEIDELGNRTSFTIDPTYHLYVTRITNALGQARTQSWNTVCSAVSSSTNENGQTTTMQHDNLCRPTRTDLPGGGFELRSYVNLGNASTQYVQVQTPAADASGNLWSRTYLDGLGRTWRTESKGPSAGKEIRTDATFDARGNTWKQTLPYYANESAKWVTTSFDALDRPLSITYPDGNKETRAYGLGTITQTDELGHQQRDELNAYGQVVQHAERLGSSWHATHYSYDLRGNLTHITDPKGNQWAIVYDSLGRRTQVSDPDAGTWHYEYDAAGQEVAHTDAKGQRTEFTYDALGRKETKTIGVGSGTASTMTWQYDQGESGYYNAGKLTAMTDPSGTASYDYDASGRLARGTRTIGAKSFTFHKGYDAGGRLKWTSYPDGDAVGTTSSPLGYDGAGRLVSIPGIVSSASYSASGDLTEHINANGTVTTRGVSATRGWLTGIQTVKGTTAIQNLSYSRDAEGKITSVTSPFANEGWNFGYDELHRLTSASNHTDASHNQTFSYDEIGNMTYNSRLGSYSYPSAGQARPHAVTTAGANGFSYDMNGNMVSGPNRSIEWNAENRPVQVNATLYSYDAEGMRLSKTIGTSTTYYVGNDYEETAGVATKYVSLGGTMVAKRVGTTTSWVHTDHQGSIQAITNGSGVEIQRLKHRPYGERLSTSTTHSESRGYTGQRTDDTGLMYLHARYYDPALGRFISPDPTIPTARTVGLNRYAYGANDPVSFTDIDGLGFFKKLFKGVKKIFKGVGKAITKVVDTVSKVPVIGGLLRVATITALGPIYGITTGDWKGLARAYATAAIMVASVVLMPACPAAGAGLMSYVGYVAGSAAVGFGAGFGVAMVNGASPQQALKAGLTGAAMSGGLATLRAFYNATVGMSPNEYTRTAGDTFGTNDIGKKLSEGSPLAKGLQNATPGGKAISGVHDWFVGSLDYVTGPGGPVSGLQICQGLKGIPLVGGAMSQMYNAVTMPIGAAITWGAYAAPYGGAIVGSRTLANDYRRNARSVSSTGWLSNASGQPFGLASAR